MATCSVSFSSFLTIFHPILQVNQSFTAQSHPDISSFYGPTLPHCCSSYTAWDQNLQSTGSNFWLHPPCHISLLDCFPPIRFRLPLLEWQEVAPWALYSKREPPNHEILEFLVFFYRNSTGPFLPSSSSERSSPFHQSVGKVDYPHLFSPEEPCYLQKPLHLS